VARRKRLLVLTPKLPPPCCTAQAAEPGLQPRVQQLPRGDPPPLGALGGAHRRARLQAHLPRTLPTGGWVREWKVLGCFLVCCAEVMRCRGGTAVY
jgi:hypothetical protein